MSLYFNINFDLYKYLNRFSSSDFYVRVLMVFIAILLLFNNKSLAQNSFIPIANNDYINVFICNSIQFNYRANDYIPSGTTVSITKLPKIGTFIDGENAQYTSSSPCTPFTFDTIVYKLCNGINCAEADIIISILPIPKIVLQNSCSFYPKLTIDYQFDNVGYKWEYSDDNGQTWKEPVPNSNSFEIIVFNEGLYRLILTLSTGSVKDLDPVTLKIDKKSTLSSGLVWYETNLLP